MDTGSGSGPDNGPDSGSGQGDRGQGEVQNSGFGPAEPGSPSLPAFPPAYPSAPPVQAEELAQNQGPGAAPMPLVVSFWCWIASAALAVVGSVLALGDRQQIIDSARQQNEVLNGEFSDAQLQAIANATITVAIVLAVVIAGLYVLFAFKLRAGRNWARIVLTILAAFALIGLVTQQDAETILSDIGGALAVVAAVLSYLPQSSMFIAESKRRLLVNRVIR